MPIDWHHELFREREYAWKLANKYDLPVPPPVSDDADRAARHAVLQAAYHIMYPRPKADRQDDFSSTSDLEMSRHEEQEAFYDRLEARYEESRGIE